MRVLIILIGMLSFNNVSFSQKIIEDFTDLFSPELIVENKIHEVVTVVKNIPNQKFTFNRLGQLVLNTEYKNWATGDTTVKYYTYSNNLKTQVVHVDVATGDTLSFDKYLYEGGVLIGEEGVQLTNYTKTNFQYYDNGNVKESVFVMMFSEGKDTSRVDHKYYDELGRIVRLDMSPFSGIAETTLYTYSDSSIVSEKENKENGEFYSSEKVLFNENLQITSIIKYKNGTNEIQSTLGLVYLDTGVLGAITMNGNSMVVFTYSYY